VGDVPVIAIARRANPLYRPTPASRAIPVPLEMSMAPIYHQSFSSMSRMVRHTRGAQPPLATFLTHSSRITALVNHTAASPIKMTAIRGMGVYIAPTNRLPSRARMKRVRRSPRHVATGAVMLSVVSSTLYPIIDEEGINIPGSMPNHLETTIIELMKLPRIALLNPALPIPVAKTMTN